jgi:hypothetical protein
MRSTSARAARCRPRVAPCSISSPSTSGSEQAARRRISAFDPRHPRSLYASQAIRPPAGFLAQPLQLPLTSHRPRFQHRQDLHGIMPLKDASRLFESASLPRWALLLASRPLLVVGLELLGLPASLLIGPMVAAIVLVVSVGQGSLRVPRWPLLFGQALVGFMMARSITVDILQTMATDAPLFLSMIFSVIVMPACSAGHADPLAGAAGHDRRLGFVARCGIRHGHHVGGLWRRCPARRLHAVSARRLRRRRRLRRLAPLGGGRWRRAARRSSCSRRRLAGAGRNRRADLPVRLRRRPLPHSRRHHHRTAGRRLAAAGLRPAEDRAADVAAGNQLRADRLEHRPALHPRHHRHAARALPRVAGSICC